MLYGVDAVWPPSNKPTAVNEMPSFLKSSAGAKADYDWEKIIIEAAGYMYEHGVPKSLADLCRHTVKGFEPDKAPGKTQLEYHLGPLFKRFQKLGGK